MKEKQIINWHECTVINIYNILLDAVRFLRPRFLFVSYGKNVYEVEPGGFFCAHSMDHFLQTTFYESDRR